MLIEPSIDKLEKMAENRHLLVLLAAKRARDLGDGLRPITEEVEQKHVSQAAKEIAEGYIKIKEND